ncbi:MAG: hypothetical protein WCR42_07930 [bacterium]
MYYIRIVLAMVIVLAAFSQLRAELPAPLITVDTLYHGPTEGYPGWGGAVFLPDGNSIISLKNPYIYPNEKSVPILIDASNGKELREFDTIPTSNSHNPQISKDGRYLFAESDLGLAVWNIQTGKILKYLRFCADYCLSPDGTKLYETIDNDNNNTGVIRVYDLNTLEEIEIFCGHDFHGGGEIAISPDGKTLAVCVSHDPIGYEGDNINRSVILINLDNKYGFTRLESFYPYNHQIQFSPDGNYLMYTYSHFNNNKITYIYIYNMLTKEKTIINDEDISNLFEYKTIFGFGNFLDTKTISIKYSKYLLVWDFKENRLKKMINFETPYLDVYNKKLVLCDYHGNLALLDLAEVSVNETTKSQDNYILYKNNQLEFYSDESFQGSTQVFDITGKMVANLGAQAFVIGKNIIQINQPLPIGVYILTIKSRTEQNNYKFLVE